MPSDGMGALDSASSQGSRQREDDRRIVGADMEPYGPPRCTMRKHHPKPPTHTLVTGSVKGILLIHCIAPRGRCNSGRGSYFLPSPCACTHRKTPHQRPRQFEAIRKSGKIDDTQIFIVDKEKNLQKVLPSHTWLKVHTILSIRSLMDDGIFPGSRVRSGENITIRRCFRNDTNKYVGSVKQCDYILDSRFVLAQVSAAPTAALQNECVRLYLDLATENVDRLLYFSVVLQSPVSEVSVERKRRHQGEGSREEGGAGSETVEGSSTCHVVRNSALQCCSLVCNRFGLYLAAHCEAHPGLASQETWVDILKEGREAGLKYDKGETFLRAFFEH
eukprot:1185668-Prorocentrum_minimum.AAC.1